MILVFGANSKIAEALARVFQSCGRKEVLFLTSSSSPPPYCAAFETRTIDAASRRDVKELCLATRPSVLINAAAFTNVDACETERREAWTVNVTLVENLAHACRLADAHLIHLSTDYVFDGERGPYAEEDTPHPLGYYGKTKLAGENACIAGNIDYTVVRTNVLYGATLALKPDFVVWALKKFDEGKPFTVVNDQYSNPTLIDDVAYAIEKVIQTRYKGVLHAGGATWLHRHAFAELIAKVFKRDASLSLPISTSELKQAAPRPLKGGLIALKAEAAFGFRFSSAEQGLQTMRRQMQLMGHIS